MAGDDETRSRQASVGAAHDAIDSTRAPKLSILRFLGEDLLFCSGPQDSPLLGE
jgi:hypothetical protein